jgi:hypothetical protein
LQEGFLLYWRQKMVQYHINKEMCTVSVVFPLFWPTAVDSHCADFDEYCYRAFALKLPKLTWFWGAQEQHCYIQSDQGVLISMPTLVSVYIGM